MAEPSREPARDAPPSTAEIRVEDLCKAFGDRPVLTGVSLGVSSGEIVAIVGGSGSGKTVLLDHIIGNHSPDKGRVLIADHSRPGAPLVDLATADEETMDRLRLQWAVVFQRNALFSGSVYENIAFWLREHTGMSEAEIRARARESVDAVGFRGDDSILGKERDELSGGMAKRIAVARALAMRPMLLFYDEPTTGLDPASAAQIHELVFATHNAQAFTPEGAPTRRTTVIITHDKDMLRRLRPRVVMLHHGTVFFDGAYERFASSTSDIIRPYFELMPVLHDRTSGW